MNGSGTILSTLTFVGMAWISGCGTEGTQNTGVANDEQVAAPNSAQQVGGDPYPALPYLSELERTLLFGDIWERPGLSRRDRSLVTVAVTQALYRTEELREYLGRALDDGVTREEIAELMTHVTMYSGWPTGSNASRVAIEVYERRGLDFPPPADPGDPGDRPAWAGPGVSSYPVSLGPDQKPAVRRVGRRLGLVQSCHHGTAA